MIGLGLYAGGSVALLGVLVVMVSSLLIVTRASFAEVGLISAIGASLTAPWNAVIVSHIRPSDALLVVALFSLLAAGFDHRALALPRWLVQLALVVVLLAILHQVLPTSPSYLQGRVVVNAVGLPASEVYTNMGIAGRWLVSLIAIPLLVRLAVAQRTEAGRWMAIAYAGGAAISGFVALTDQLGVTAISALFILPGLEGRQSGLTLLPNHLAAASALAVSISVWLLVQKERWTTLAGATCLTGTLIGAYESGSRGGAVAALLALMLSVVLMRRLRRNLLLIGLGVISAIMAVVAALPQIVSQFAKATRLGGSAVANSDSVRGVLAAQARHDFTHSPVIGIGLQAALDAHSIYLQVLAAGGVILLSSFLIFAAGALWSALKHDRPNQLPIALFISMVALLAFGAVENGLTDRYLYFPVALIIAAVGAHPRSGRSESELEHETGRESAGQVSGAGGRSPAGERRARDQLPASSS